MYRHMIRSRSRSRSLLAGRRTTESSTNFFLSHYSSRLRSFSSSNNNDQPDHADTKRHLSSVSVQEESSSRSSGGCPFTRSKDPQSLKQAPTLPFLGSMWSSYSGTPPFDPSTLYNYYHKMDEKFGVFYTVGIPGFGAGLHGTVHFVMDPEEMIKVIRKEGAYPSGIVQKGLFVIQALKDDKSPLFNNGDLGLLGQGERWKRHRTFLQTGMLDPKSANKFLPGIQKAAQLASKAAPENKDDLNRYLNYCAFDMFSSFMFGELTQCAGNDIPENDENIRFCKAAITVMEQSASMIQSPYQLLLHSVGLKSKDYRDLKDEWDIVREIAMKKLNAFIDRYERGELNEIERASYFANALDRLPASDITKEEMLEICTFSLFAAVDTTSGVTAWNLVHLALNPEVQEKLYKELSLAAAETGGELTARALDRKTSPFLHAVVRENYRLTPPFPFTTFKSNSQGEIDIHGITVPKDSVISLGNPWNNTRYLQDAREFKPERWLKEAVEARKGTDLEVMDHPLFRDNFGQGARRCPGSRVATNEVLSMLAQLVLDYEIVSPINTLDEIKYDMPALIVPDIPPLEFRKRQRTG